MNIHALRIIKLQRYAFAGIMVFAMFLIAQFSGQKEIIFPEVLAIMTGAWISEIQPWNVNKRKMFLLICIASILGVAIVKYVNLNLFFQVLICFVGVGLSLILTKTNFIPIISACILPIYLRTDSWIYSLAVIIMAVLIVSAQWLMEKFKLRPKNHYEIEEFNTKEEVNRWIKLFLIFGLVAIIPIESRNIFFLAPPLVVMFAEFANPKSPLRQKAINIWIIMILASFIGTLFRLILTSYLNFPLVLSACVACIILFFIFDNIHILFPPAGAIVLLPMVLQTKDLFWFPLEVAVGASFLIPIALLLFKEEKSYV